jgi:hypothetical protein
MPTGNDTFLSEMDIRIWLRDLDPAANKLLDDFEFKQEEIRTAATLAVDYWNETPPAIQGYELYQFPYRYNLLMGTAANLLFMAAHLYRRNQLNYNVPGGGISDQDRAKEYDAAGEKLWQQYKEWCSWKKKSLNVHQGWGQI